MAKYCPYCGTELGERSRFCPRCGKQSPKRNRESAASVQDAAVETASRSGSSGHLVGHAAPAPAKASADASARLTGARSASAVTGRIPANRARMYAPPTNTMIGALEQAGFGLRYGAWMFDFLISLIAMMGFTFLVTAISNKSVVGSNSDLLIVAGLSALLFLLNFVVLAGWSGQSAGMRILGIRIVRIDGSPFTARHAILRHVIGYPLSSIALFLGFLWMMWDPRQQGWHDKLAHTIVVVAR